MKKIIITVLLVLMLAIAAIVIATNKNEKNSNLTKLKVAEVTHSIFYAPQYLAKELGYFEEEGLDIELILTPGVNNINTLLITY